MTSFFIVNISFVFSILFFVSGTSAMVCHSDVPYKPGDPCYGKSDGVVIPDPVAPTPTNTTSKSGGSRKHVSGGNASAKKPPKNSTMSAPAEKSDDSDFIILGDEPNASGGGFCPNRDDECRRGYRCDKGICLKESDVGDSVSHQTNACMQQYEGLMQRCRMQINETASTCDEKNDAGMNSTLDNAAQLTTALGQSVSGSVQQSCSDSAALMQGANGALAAYSKVCSSSIEDCSAACSEAKKFAIENNSCMSNLEAGFESDLTMRADESIKQCKAFDAKVDQADQAINNFAKTLANAANCQQATSGDSSLGNGVQKICASQPNYPGCNPAAPVDCSKPELATSNKVCICSKNPMDPACSGSQKMAGDNGLGPNIDPASRLNKSGPDMFGGDLQDLPLPEHGNVNTSVGKAIDGHQGGNAALGGGDSGAGGGPSGSGGSSTGGAGDQASSSGFYGSGGRIGNYGPGGGYYDGGSGGGRNANGAAFPGKNNNPDLRKFLPGGQFDPRRGLAGMTGPDGITGPHTDIWRKIQNRYQVMQPSLLP